MKVNSYYSSSFIADIKYVNTFFPIWHCFSSSQQFAFVKRKLCERNITRRYTHFLLTKHLHFAEFLLYFAIRRSLYRFHQQSVRNCRVPFSLAACLRRGYFLMKAFPMFITIVRKFKNNCRSFL